MRRRRLWKSRIITVDHARSLSKRLEAGKYEKVHPYITEENFPITLTENREEKMEITFFFLSQLQNSKNAIFPIGIEELLAIGEQFPDLMRSSPIVALKSVRSYPFGKRIGYAVPCLYQNDHSGREVGIFCSPFWPDYKVLGSDYCCPAIRVVDNPMKLTKPVDDNSSPAL